MPLDLLSASLLAGPANRYWPGRAFLAKCPPSLIRITDPTFGGTSLCQASG